MESLLSVSFDNLSSRDHARVRKGLRQIEGLLAQICLSSSRLSPHKQQHRRTPAERSGGGGGGGGDKGGRGVKPLGELRRDAAFREFFRLQEGFRWNVASRLTASLERLMGQPASDPTDALILSTLDALHGLLLLHPPSRILFNREDTMNLLLDLLDPSNPPRVQSQALLVLVAALLGEPSSTRTFERVDGLLTVTSLFKGRATPQDVKMRTLEFLYFYLMPEAAPTTASSAPNTAVGPRGGGGDRLAGHARTHSGESREDVGMEMDGAGEGEGPAAGATETKTTEAKQKLLGRHLSNVDELVRDIRENAVFGTALG